MAKKITILSRSSFLAKVQTHLAAQRIKKIYKGKVEVIYSETIGDADKTAKAWEKHGFGIFTNSLSKSLIDKQCDIVIHSFKDLPVKNSIKTSFVCLERDDPRDVLLIKKKSIKQKKLSIGTSSPRRAYYLKHLKKILPFSNFHSLNIRGNITTRLLKVLEEPKYDGLFMAKAAIDRVFKYGNEVNAQECRKFKKLFAQFEKIVLPLSEFPSAAAQGCIALEYRSQDKTISALLKKINHGQSEKDCLEERNFLGKWGGGCSLNIGVTIENIAGRRILFSRGKDFKAKKYFHEKDYLGLSKTTKVKEIFPNNLKNYQMFKRSELALKDNLKNKNLIITRANNLAAKNLKGAKHITTSGVSTWQKVNKIGVLANSSFDGFGEGYRPLEKHYFDIQQKPIKLTYKGNELNQNYTLTYHYELTPSINEATINNLFNATSFYWMSFSAFELALKLRPEILHLRNACGPGNTFNEIAKIIPKNKLNVYLGYEDFKKFELK